MGYDVNKFLEIALNEYMYMEKKSGDTQYLFTKDKNVGSSNWTKYWYELGYTTTHNAWCQCFVDWVTWKLCGEDTKKAKELLCYPSNTSAWSFYTPTASTYFKNKGQWSTKPQVGAIIYYKNDIRIYHVGIVYKLEYDSNGKVKYIHTIEGNTSSGSGNSVVPNGGGVFKKKRTPNSSIAGYGIIKFDNATTTTQTSTKPTTTTSKSDYDKYRVKNDMVKEWQKAMNIGFDTKELEVDGDWYKKSQEFCMMHMLYNKQKHDCPTAIKWLQKTLKEKFDFNKLEVDGKWSTYLTTCVKTFQKNRNIEADGIVGVVTTYYLLK